MFKTEDFNLAIYLYMNDTLSHLEANGRKFTFCFEGEDVDKFKDEFYKNVKVPILNLLNAQRNLKSLIANRANLKGGI